MKTGLNWFLLPICLGITMNTYAQTTESKKEKKKSDAMKLNYYSEAAVRNPILRQVVVSTEFSGNADIKSELHGNKLFDGKISQSKTNVLLTIPLLSWGKNSITGSLLFENQQFRLSDVKAYQPEYQNALNDLKLNRNSVGFSAGYQRLDSLFGRNVVYMANVNGLTGKEGSIQRLGFLGTFLVNLKQTETTNFSAGLVLNIDKSVNFPVFPIITYWHKFSNGLELNVNLPQQAYLRKDINNRLSTSVGTTLSASSSFFNYKNQSIMPQDINYTVLGLQSGVAVEYRLGKKIILGLNGGVQTPLSARGFEVGESSNDYFLQNKIGAAPYVKLSVSLLPMLRSVF